jgi:hypothetical protein
MYSALPSLALLEGVRISGTVTYVSPLGAVWFSPRWAQEKLALLSARLDRLEPELQPAGPAPPGTLCLARSEDGCMYRARVTGVAAARPDAWLPDTSKVGISVEFFDFGNVEQVEAVLEYPAALGLELAAAAAEVVLARPPAARGAARLALLEAGLVGDGEMTLELQLEKDAETGMKVARFYEDGEEVMFDNKIEPNSTKAELAGDRDEVVQEVEVEVKDPEVEEKAAEAAVEVVPGPVLPRDGVQPVEVLLVETVARVWVQRREDVVKVGRMMAALAGMTARLAPARRPSVGCVYGARFSEDDVMYRAVVEGEEPDGGIIVRYIDFGNMERKEKNGLLHLTDKMARFPAAAQVVTLEENTVAEDSEANRDVVEETLEGDLELMFEQGKCVAVKKSGVTVQFSFNKRTKVEVIQKDAVLTAAKASLVVEKAAPTGVSSLASSMTGELTSLQDLVH